eukprot:988771-Amphidinium_carterae.2
MHMPNTPQDVVFESPHLQQVQIKHITAFEKEGCMGKQENVVTLHDNMYSWVTRCPDLRAPGAVRHCSFGQLCCPRPRWCMVHARTPTDGANGMRAQAAVLPTSPLMERSVTFCFESLSA